MDKMNTKKMRWRELQPANLYFFKEEQEAAEAKKADGPWYRAHKTIPCVRTANGLYYAKKTPSEETS